MSTQTKPAAAQHNELRVVGSTLCTVGMVFICLCVATGAMALTQVAALERTLIGEAIAALMIVGGELFKRRREDTWFGTTWFGTQWLSTAIMSSGYSLAYFFVYSLYYVPALRSMETPYATWLLTAAIGVAGTYHGTINKTLKWFASVFTLVVTGHVLYQAFYATGSITVGTLTLKAAALGCLGGMLWSAAMSAVHKRLEQPFGEKGATPDKAHWLLHRALHEAYFVVAGLTAMAVPLIQSSWLDAPLCWPLEAAILLAITYRSGNFIKHAGVGAMWLAGAVTLAAATTQTVQPSSWLSILSVLVTGAGIAATYRFVKTNNEQWLRRLGCQTYLFASIAVALTLPFLRHIILASTQGLSVSTQGWIAATQIWMIEGVVIAGIGVALRHGKVHLAGAVISLAALVAFYEGSLGSNWQDWSWALLAPIIMGAYALSAGYSYVIKKGGLKQSKFFEAEPNEEAISLHSAELLEIIWSWVGCGTLFVACWALVNHEITVMWWSVEALILIGVSFYFQRINYRLQGLMAIVLSCLKLFPWNGMSVTVSNAIQYGVVGATALIASFLYFREERRRMSASPAPLAAPSTGQTDRQAKQD